MNEKMMKMMKGKSKLSPLEKEAKMLVMKALSDDMSNELKDKLKGLKKVTIASNSPEGLKAGLKKAEDMIEDKMQCDACGHKGCPMCPKMSEAEEMDSEDSEDEEYASEDEEMSMEEIDRKIAELEKMKALKARV